MLKMSNVKRFSFYIFVNFLIRDHKYIIIVAFGVTICLIDYEEYEKSIHTQIKTILQLRKLFVYDMTSVYNYINFILII